MDLREKPGKVQKTMEMLLRFRLISAAVMIVAAVSFVASRWQELASLPVGASEALGMWMAEVEGVSGIWQNGQFLSVAAITAVVLFLVFGGFRAAFAAVVSLVLSIGGLVVLGGNESMPTILFGALLLISLVGLIFVKLSVACGLFPFVLGWLFFTGLISAMPDVGVPSWLLWAVLSSLGFAGSMALSAVAGKHLGSGTPQAGALVKAAKQMVVPMVLTSLLGICAVAFDMRSEVAAEAASAADAAAEGVKQDSNVGWGAAFYFFVFNIWFFVLLYPSMSFARWERLRSGSRRVEMKEKKKKPAAKGKKK